MNCAICMGRLKVREVLHPNDGSLTRLRECVECHTQFGAEEIIKTVYVKNPLTPKSEEIPIKNIEKYSAFLAGKDKHPAHQQRMFE